MILPDMHALVDLSLSEAIEVASSQDTVAEERKMLNAKRSRYFVERLAHWIRSHYETVSDETLVFSKYYKPNRQKFGTQEYMYDIHVCQLGHVDAIQRRLKIPYVEKSIWQIESELEGSTNELLLDFSKLVAGSGSHKMFIGPIVGRSQDTITATLRSLLPAARACSGRVHLSLLPYPEKWLKSACSALHFVMQNGEWRPVDDGTCNVGEKKLVR